MTLKELQEKRSKLAAEIRRLADKFNADGKEWKAPEDRAAFDKVNAEYDATLVEIEAAQKRQAEVDAVEARRQQMDRDDSRSSNDPAGIIGRSDSRAQRPVGGNAITEETRSLAMAGFALGPNNSRFTEQHAEAMVRCGIGPNWSEAEFRLGGTGVVSALRNDCRSRHHSLNTAETLAEHRALSSITSQEGGALVFPSFVRQIETNMLAFGGMRQVAETIRTASGERMTWPTADDTTNTGEQLGENTDVTDADPDFGGVAWDAFKFSSKMVKVPYELLEDSAFDLPGRIGAMLGERLGRITNTRFTTGSGANTPKGILTAAGTFSAASATAITFDDVFKLYHSIDPAYRTGASWMMHDAITLILRLLKDGQGRYLWQSGVQDGMPDRVLGLPITVNQDMDSTVSSTKKSILFGQLSKYKIRTVNSIRLRRLDERYAEKDQVGFIAFVREDGNLLDAGTDPVKALLH
jgi:HK97 family phage major capsid protein